MLQDDFILRQIREMVHAVMKMLFQVSASELTPEVIEDSTARTTLENLIALTDEGKIDEAENQLYEMTCDGVTARIWRSVFFFIIILMERTMTSWKSTISAVKRS